VNSHARPLTGLVVGVLALATAGCAAAVEPTPTLTVTASAPAWTEGVNPDWEFLTAIRTSGMEFSGDWEADLEAAGMDLGQVETVQLRSQVCGSAMDDGEGDYNPDSQTHRFWLSTFYDEVRRMGRDYSWNAPKTVAYHHCPSRFDAVGAVQDLEARVKGG
jgi:hypothetical protein